jgi:hypothetical protein
MHPEAWTNNPPSTDQQLWNTQKGWFSGFRIQWGSSLAPVTWLAATALLVETHGCCAALRMGQPGSVGRLGENDPEAKKGKYYFVRRGSTNFRDGSGSWDPYQAPIEHWTFRLSASITR